MSTNVKYFNKFEPRKSWKLLKLPLIFILVKLFDFYCIFRSQQFSFSFIFPPNLFFQELSARFPTFHRHSPAFAFTLTVEERFPFDMWIPSIFFFAFFHTFCRSALPLLPVLHAPSWFSDFPAFPALLCDT